MVTAPRRPTSPAEWLALVVKLGVPSVIALWMVYSYTTTFTVRIEAMTLAITAKIDGHAEESRQAAARQLMVLQQICVNTGKSAAERASCLSVQRDR